MKEVRNLTGLKTLKTAYIQSRNLLKALKLIDAQMTKDNIEACSGLEVSTHSWGVDTWNPETFKESTYDLKESTHMVIQQSKIEVSTHAFWRVDTYGQ